jgi:hypothetical protein
MTLQRKRVLATDVCFLRKISISCYVGRKWREAVSIPFVRRSAQRSLCQKCLLRETNRQTSCSDSSRRCLLLGDCGLSKAANAVRIIRAANYLAFVIHSKGDARDSHPVAC